MARVSLFLLVLLFSGANILAERIVLREEKPIPDSFAFGEELAADDLVTWYELERLAAAENRIVLPDCSLGGQKDDLARWIPEEGLHLQMRPKKAKRVFLYLDFVGIVDQTLQSPGGEMRCIPAMKETVFDSARRGTYEWVEVRVNGKRKAIFYQGHDVGFTGPLVVPISRDEFSEGLIEIEIVPSGRFFALWDLFLSHIPPD